MFLKWIEASAGCGKTTFLINEALKKKENILFLTFSKAACSEIISRLYEVNLIENIKVDTIHAFAYELIKEKFPEKKISEKTYEKEAKVLLLKDPVFFELNSWLLENSDENIIYQEFIDFDLSKEEAPYFIEELDELFDKNLIEYKKLQKLKSYFFTQKNELRKKIKLPIDYIEKALLRINMHEKFLEKYIKSVKNKLFIAISNKENEIKKNLNILYYDDLIHEAYDLISKDSGEFVFKFLGNIKYIFIDEAQDLSLNQWQFLYSLLNEWKVLNGELIISGDSKQIIYEFQGAHIYHYKTFKEKIRKISDKFEEIVLNKSYRLPIKVCDFLNKLGKKLNINYINHETNSKIQGNIEILKINDYKDLLNIIDESFMILFKQKSEKIENFAKQLISSGYFLNSPYIMLHPIIKDFQHLLKWLIYKDKLSLGVLFKIFSSQSLTYNEILNHEYEISFLKSLQFDDLYNLFNKWINFLPVQTFLSKKLENSYDFFINFLRKYCEFYRYDPYEAISDSNKFFQNNMKFFEQGIFFNTIHSAKGKEANSVILLDCDSKNKYNNDTKRLLYVGLTRTKNILYIPILKESYEDTWANLILSE